MRLQSLGNTISSNFHTLRRSISFSSAKGNSWGCFLATSVFISMEFPAASETDNIEVLFLPYRLTKPHKYVSFATKSLQKQLKRKHRYLILRRASHLSFGSEWTAFSMYWDISSKQFSGPVTRFLLGSTSSSMLRSAGCWVAYERQRVHKSTCFFIYLWIRTMAHNPELAGCPRVHDSFMNRKQRHAKNALFHFTLLLKSQNKHTILKSMFKTLWSMPFAQSHLLDAGQASITFLQSIGTLSGIQSNKAKEQLAREPQGHRSASIQNYIWSQPNKSSDACWLCEVKMINP